MSNSRPSQCQRLLQHMLSGEAFTQIKALTELGIGRLPSRIFELKEQGYQIKDHFVKVINRYGEECQVKEYWLETNE